MENTNLNIDKIKLMMAEDQAASSMKLKKSRGIILSTPTSKKLGSVSKKTSFSQDIIIQLGIISAEYWNDVLREDTLTVMKNKQRELLKGEKN